MVDATKKTPPLTTVKVTPELLMELVNEQNRLRNAGEGKVSQGDIVHKAWRCYVESRTGSTPGTSLGPKNGTKKLQQTQPNTGNLPDISSDLSETEKVYLHKCLGLLRSMVCDLFRTMVDALADQLRLINERPRNHVAAAGAEIDRKLDAAEALAEDTLRGLREELHGTDSDAGGSEGRDRRGRKKPA